MSGAARHWPRLQSEPDEDGSGSTRARRWQSLP